MKVSYEQHGAEAIEGMLEYLAATEADDIECDEFEMIGEDEEGREGSCEVSIVQLAGEAAKTIRDLKNRLEAATDYSESKAVTLDLVAKALGVTDEPHQGKDERILETLDALVSNRRAPGRSVEPPPWYVTAEKPWFAYCPEQGLMAFGTEAEAIRQGQEFIDGHLDECWSEEVDRVFVGCATQITAQVDLIHRPDSSELDEDGFDTEGRSWNQDWDWICNYRLQPVVSGAAKAYEAASSTAFDDQLAPDLTGEGRPS